MLLKTDIIQKNRLKQDFDQHQYPEMILFLISLILWQ